MPHDNRGLAKLRDPVDLTMGDVVTAALRDLAEKFDDTESPALAGEPDAVHRHRTVVGRVRGVLAVFSPVFDPFAAKKLRGLLREWGSALGTVRDREVAAQLAEKLLAETMPARDVARLTERLVLAESDSARSARLRIVEIHDLHRLREMRRSLRAFSSAPSLTAVADERSSGVQELLLHDGARVLRAARHLTDSLASHHALRKRARRLRHAVEAIHAVQPSVLGDPWSDVAKSAHRIQSALGDHRDLHLLATRIERARTLAGRDGEDVVAYDDLVATARAGAMERDRAARKARKKLARALADAR